MLVGHAKTVLLDRGISDGLLDNLLLATSEHPGLQLKTSLST